ncbi:MAG: hypothetical protein KAU48_05715 [Candidatus Thorarchaeota archaeon]|nr:hypothetical protein [Candidatus Thorarchaeota archaeon]
MNYNDVQEMVNTESSLVSESLLSQESSLGNSIRTYRAIITALILAVFQDLQKQDTSGINKEDLGWRNKYHIHLMSGVSQKQIYKECGVLEKLIEVGIIEKRPSRSRWGKQRHQYRLDFSSFFRRIDGLSLRPQ